MQHDSIEYVGYIILTAGTHHPWEWRDDWDAEVHITRDAANAAYIEAINAPVIRDWNRSNDSNRRSTVTLKSSSDSRVAKFCACWRICSISPLWAVSRSFASSAATVTARSAVPLAASVSRRSAAISAAMNRSSAANCAASRSST